jgi:glycosidase
MIQQLFLILFFCALSLLNFAQLNEIERIDPPNWWIEMNDNSLQLLIKGDNLQHAELEWKTPGVKIDSIVYPENENYIILNIDIKPWALAGMHIIKIQIADKSILVKYPMLQRTPRNSSYGLDANDLIYLIMPDRFSDGDQDNNIISGMNETKLCRDSMFLRHGGDIQGIIDHLDYIDKLGITALWLTPVLENNQDYESYHGYAITDHYTIDPRFGSLQVYKALVDSCHQRNIKIIMDMVFNHVGDKHYLYTNPPQNNCFHQFDTFTQTSYRATTLMDPYATESDKKQFSNAWFDHHMPDLNQQNDIVANYLIQNSIWWIETVEIDAIRLDTYAYSNQEFMAEWAKRIFKEYPNFGLFGETWVHGISVQQWFASGIKSNKKFNSLLPGTTDFQWYYAVLESLNQEQSWTDGVSKLYYTLAKDYLYETPEKQVIFLDNHDLSRFYSMVNEDYQKFKSGIILLMTMRGIPMLYYGTEILMKNYANPDGKVREDFPGGWNNDTENAFTEQLSPKQIEAQELIRTLANLRKNHAALRTGSFKHFIPKKGVYVYFRFNNSETFMIALNTSNNKSNLKNFSLDEFTNTSTSAIDMLTNEHIDNIFEWEIKPKTCYLFKIIQ